MSSISYRDASITRSIIERLIEIPLIEVLSIAERDFHLSLPQTQRSITGSILELLIKLFNTSRQMAVSPEAAAIIQRKKARYCRYADTQQWHRFDEIMLPDATYVFHDRDGNVLTKGDVQFSWSSREDWAAFFKTENKDIQAVHLVGPAEMEQISADEIKSIWAVVYHAGTKEAEGGVHGTGGGHYHEIWKKVGDDWFMKSMKMERLYWKVISS